MVELENDGLDLVEVDFSAEIEERAVKESIDELILRQLMELPDDSDEIVFVDYSVIESIWNDLQQTNTIKRMLGVKDLTDRLTAALNMIDVEREAGNLSGAFFDIAVTLQSNAEVDYYSLKIGNPDVV